MFLLGDVYDDLRDAAAQAVYIGVLRNLLFFKQKLAKSYGPRRTVIDEIVLHGTESKASQEQSATYLQSVIGIHYFIGRDSGLAYRIVPDEYQSFHAGNPKLHSKVQDHNPKSIGIEMYQQDISVLRTIHQSSILPTGSTRLSRYCATIFVIAGRFRGPIL